MFHYAVVRPPQAEPLTLDEAKGHLRVDFDDEDALIGALISVARERVEATTNRALISQGVRLVLDSFPNEFDEIELPLPPLVSIESMQYFDSAGVIQSMSKDVDFLLNDTAEPARITPMPNQRWPTVQKRAAAITIEYTAGYGDEGDAVPESIKSAMKLIIGHLYLNREAVADHTMVAVPMAVDYLLAPYRVVTTI